MGLRPVTIFRRGKQEHVIVNLLSWVQVPWTHPHTTTWEHGWFARPSPSSNTGNKCLRILLKLLKIKSLEQVLKPTHRNFV